MNLKKMSKNNLSHFDFKRRNFVFEYFDITICPFDGQIAILDMMFN